MLVRVRRSVSVVSFLALALALALTLSLVCQASAGVEDRHWQRLQRLSGIELYTDINTKAALELYEELQRFDGLIDQFVQPVADAARAGAPEWLGEWRSTATDAGLKVVVLGKRRDFERLFPDTHFTALIRPTLQQTMVVVGPSRGRASLRKNLFHEYVHYRLRRDVPAGLPLWYEEGLAAYLSSLMPQSKPDARTTAKRSARSPPIDNLLDRRSLSGMTRSEVRHFYQGALSLVRHVYEDSGIDHTVLAAAPAGARAEAGAPDTMTGCWLLPSLEPRSESEWVSVEVVAINEVRRMLAASALSLNPIAAAKLYAKAERALPTAIWPILGQTKALRLQDKKQQAVRRLEEAQALATQSADRAAVLLEKALTATSGCIIAPKVGCSQAWRDALRDLEQALAIDPSNYDLIYRLGIAYLYTGQPEIALEYLQVAWQRARWSPRVNYFMGESLRRLKDRRAQWYLANAQRWAVSPFYQKAAAEGLQWLPDDRDKLLK